MKWLCCFSKNTVIEINNTKDEATIESDIKTIQSTKSSDFNPTTDSILVPANLETTPSIETLSDNDSVVATVGSSYDDIKELEQTKDISENNPIEQTKVEFKKKLKSSSKYTMGKNVSYFYLSVDRYYFIKNKNDNKEILFGKFMTIDKTKKNYAVFQISGIEDNEKFDLFDYCFYRAIPKHK